MSAMDCNDCNLPTDPDDAAPSCGSHVLCVRCYTTSDFRCRECQRVWREVEGVRCELTLASLAWHLRGTP